MNSNQSVWIDTLQDGLWPKKSDDFHFEVMSKPRCVYNDRGALESALRDALDHCASEQDLFEISFDLDNTRNRKHYWEHLYLSSLPVHVFDEIELDQEINSIEEEIARLQEQKLLLKKSASLDNSLDSCSSGDENSQISSLEDSEEENNIEELELDLSDQELEDEDEYIPPNQTDSKKILKRKRNTYVLEDIPTPQPQVNKKQKHKHKQKQRLSQKIDIQLVVVPSHSTSSSPSHNVSNSDTNYSVTSSPNSGKKLKPSLRQRKEEVFQVEEVLIIKPSTSTEDEDVDILN